MLKRTMATALVCFLLFSSSLVSAYTPNDSFFSFQWHFDTIGLQSAWDYNRGGRSDVKVAVIDTGVAWDLQDFSGTNFDRGNARDWIGGDRVPDDLSGHGTHVTGTIAQTTNNGFGVAGIAFNTTILPIRVLDAEGVGSTADTAAAINYAVSRGADIINLSLGTDPWYDSPELARAAMDAYNAGVLVVAAAGNSGQPFLDNPAAYPGVLAVGAVDLAKRRAYYSNFSEFMVMAPGGDEFADLNRDGFADGVLQQTADGGFWFLSGTSMAAPHVSGVAALILAEAYDLGLGVPGKNSARVDWLAGIIAGTAEDLGSSGPDPIYGYGLVRADRAMQYLNN